MVNKKEIERNPKEGSCRCKKCGDIILCDTAKKMI